MNQLIRTYTSRESVRGFSLVELLIAIAIFLTVLGGVGALFLGAMRTTRQGFQAQEAFELARGTLSIVEKDVNRAFTSREHGDIYNLYGTPIGFSFVGLSAIRDRGEPNIARVTYVMYHESSDPLSDSGAMRTIEEELRSTFMLLRYVETNREDLDHFPVDWYNIDLRDQDVSGPVQTLGSLIDGACNCDGRNAGRLTEFETQMANAKKRELWIRLLSGGDVEVPNGWNPMFQLDRRIAFKDGVTVQPLDYVVTENLLHVASNPFIFPEILPINPDVLTERARAEIAAQVSDNTRPFFFSYRVIQADANGQIVPTTFRYWNDTRNELAGVSGSPISGGLPQEIISSFVIFFQSAYPGAPDFSRKFDQRIDLPTGYKRLPPV